MTRKKHRPAEPEPTEAAEAGQPAPEAAAGEPANEWRDRYLRALAELDNYRKRMERERESARTYALEGLLRELLPVVDSLESALQVDGSLASIREGVAIALRHLVTALEGKGVKAVECVGRPFDPRLHEALGGVPAEGKAPGTVVTELRRGYAFHDRVLRPSRVQIAVAPPAAEPVGE